MVRGLHGLSPIAGLEDLTYLFRQSLKHVTKLPDFSRLTKLQTVWHENMKGLTDLPPLLTAPALQKIAVVDMAHLQPQDVGIPTKHPALQQVLPGLASNRKNEAVRKHVGIPSGGGWSKPDNFQVD